MFLHEALAEAVPAHGDQHQILGDVSEAHDDEYAEQVCDANSMIQPRQSTQSTCMLTSFPIQGGLSIGSLLIFIVITFSPDMLYTSVRSRPILSEKNILGNPKLCGFIVDHRHCWFAEELSPKP
jgi:hypothetical protein